MVFVAVAMRWSLGCRWGWAIWAPPTPRPPQSLVPEFLYLLPVADWEVRRRLLRIGRVSLSLKLFSRFRQVRLIVLAIMKALKVGDWGLPLAPLPQPNPGPALP